MSRRIEITEPASSGSGIPASTVTAKGDLIAATGNAAVTHLPVGTDTQVLTADSTQATGVKWAPAAGGGGGSAWELFRIRGATPNRRHMASPGTTVTTLSTTVDTMFFVPFVSGVTTIADRLAFEVFTAGTTGSVARAGIYSALTDGTFLPNALVVDGGEFVTTTTGVKDATISASLSSGTLYWFCTLAGVAAPTLNAFSNTAQHIIGYPAADFSGVFSFGKAAQAYGALPATAPAITLTSGVFPIIGVRLT